MVSVSPEGRYFIGCNPGGDIYWMRRGTGEWNQLDGGLKWVACSSNMGLIVGVNNGNEIYWRAGIHGEWAKMDGGLSNVSISAGGDMVIGCNEGGDIYHCFANPAAFKRGGW